MLGVPKRHSIRGHGRATFWSMKSTLEGKKVVVVGGTSGIGHAVAEAAKREAANVVVASRRHGLDVLDEAKVKAFLAGDSLRLAHTDTLDLEAARAAFDVRIFGALAALKHARVRKTGSITLTSGVAAKRPQAGWVLGAAVTSAMEGIGRALAVDLAPVRVNVVSPGIVRTALWAPMGAAAESDLYASAGAKLLVGRVGEADEVAETYVALMKSGFTTGQTVIVDGGATLI
jgi:NAD(P)-dependent dehydrogenase (short-subunit alcohol dehydrogenase family)